MNNPAPPPTSATPPLQIGVQIQYIKDFSFENPNAPQIFAPTQTPPEVHMSVHVNARRMADNATHEVVLSLRLEAKVDGKTALIAELAYAGLFVLPPLPEEQTRLLVLVECPRLLFPFARSILSNAVREGGFPHILIHPIDFAALHSAGQNATLPVAGTA
jgi:preprotein translocase subunit SecB